MLLYTYQLKLDKLVAIIILNLYYQTMKKIVFFSLLLFLSLSLFSTVLLAQEPSLTPTPDPDIQSSYKMECLELPGDIKEDKTKTPPPVLNTTLKGECSNKNGCYLAMCVISLGGLGKLSFDEFNAQHGDIGEGSPKLLVELAKTFEGNLNEYCTTGKSDRDIFYFGQDFTSILSTYNLEVISKP